jgi:lipopolysaccharide/colanic/teichoic acid biosynthesis glycosyltransferase
MQPQRSNHGISLDPLGMTESSAVERLILPGEAFRRLIALERKRSERSRQPFVLMLLERRVNRRPQSGEISLEGILQALCQAIRETDVAGWYENGSVIGIMFTELARGKATESPEGLLIRMRELLRATLKSEALAQMNLSFHVYPEDSYPEDNPHDDPKPPRHSRLYPDLAERDKTRKVFRGIKRAMDIAGSLTALTVLSPAFIAIALAVKLTSRGPIFYKQRRIGQYGISFPLLKFRSMYDGNNSHAHREYVSQLIDGVAEKHPGNGNGVYKLTGDKRITIIGKLLRRTSLDELPQFINVLRGEMSLVGPRPPIDYEVERYQLWHRRRLIEAKPGITGLWQVAGRNRIAFDDMVRLDLLYAKAWSPWVDLQILLRTPKAVIEGAH